MADIIRFPAKGYPIDASTSPAEPPRPWKVIIIGRDGDGAFRVTAWSVAPTSPGARSLGLGFAKTLIEAADIARTKATELGVSEMYDFSAVAPLDEPPEPDDVA